MTKLKDLDLPVVLGRCSEIFGDRRKRKFVQLPSGSYILMKWWRIIKCLVRTKGASVDLFDDLMIIYHRDGQTWLRGEELD